MVTLSPRVRRLRANNPSPMTLDGTNGYLVRVGPGALAAIDPGPRDDAQRDAFVAAARELDAEIVAILVTHGHPDHWPGAAPLSQATGAPVYAHRDAVFPHDEVLHDGERMRFEDASIVALEAPGHARDHLVFVLEDERALFAGDVVLGTGTVVVAPPGGDMRAYQRTLHRLRDDFGDATALYGGHGPEVRDVAAKLDEYIAHREMRERQIVDALGSGLDTIPAMVEHIYRDVDRRLWPAAARQILAYLIALEREGAVSAREVERAPTASEDAVLNPDLSRLDENAGADVVRAELGYGATQRLVRYEIASTILPN